MYYTIVLCFLLILLFPFAFYRVGKNQKDIEYNKTLRIEKRELLNNIDELKFSKQEIEKTLEVLNGKIETTQKFLYEAQKSKEETLKNQEEIFKRAYVNYCDTLDAKYIEVEDEYNKMISALKDIYHAKQLKTIEETKEISLELEKMRATRAAAIEAQRREKEIKENTSFYCIHQSQEDLEDITRLERIKPSLHSPRILSMLIWSTFWQKSLKTLAAQVLGTGNEVCGIYKITNIKTNECYIGQAKDIAKRWAEHAKCGLGIDTPANNKLYKAIMEYGLQNFSFELLEKVPSNQLDEKEQFYISMYDSVNFGYNTLKGINLIRG